VKCSKVSAKKGQRKERGVDETRTLRSESKKEKEKHHQPKPPTNIQFRCTGNSQPLWRVT
jgi:hypothetical protein